MDDDAPAAVVAAVRREDPARWLPLALAKICSGLCGGAPCDHLEDWGILTPDDAAEINAQRSLANFRALSAQLSARHA